MNRLENLGEKKCHAGLLFVMIQLCLFNSSTYSQEKSEKPRTDFGITLRSVFSGEYVNGISPALTVDRGRHQVSIGPRFEFTFLQGKSDFYHSDFVLDFNYRYYFGKNSEENILKPYGLFSIEYILDKSSHNWYYDPTAPVSSPAGAPEVFDHAFTLRRESRYHSLDFRLGAGVEMRMYKALYLSIEAAYGVEGSFGKTVYSDLNTGEIERTSKSPYHIWEVSMIATAGIGYRF